MLVGLRIGAWVSVLGLVACDPEILSGGYLCGPQMACPSDQECNPAEGTCVRPEQVRPFACMPGSEDGEPNGDRATATVLTLSGCPAPQDERLGCMPVGDDVDWIAVTAPGPCARAALSIDVRYAAAFAPTVVEQMTDEGLVAQTAVACDITGGLGANDAVCLDTTVPPSGVVMIRIGLDRQLSCDGACDFSHYSVTVSAAAP